MEKQDKVIITIYAVWSVLVFALTFAIKGLDADNVTHILILVFFFAQLARTWAPATHSQFVSVNSAWDTLSKHLSTALALDSMSALVTPAEERSSSSIPAMNAVFAPV